MKPFMTTGLSLAGLVFLSAVAGAQAPCPEGRTASGACVNPVLADTMRQTAIIFSQPKLSYTHYPVLPSTDASVRYPNQLNPDPLLPSATGTPLPPPIVIIIP